MPVKKKTSKTAELTATLAESSAKLPVETHKGIAEKAKPETLTVELVRLHPDARIPQYQSEGAACFDITVPERAYISPLRATGLPILLRTGIAVAIPEGYHMKIFLRSSIGRKTTLRLANQTGIIDSDYRGEIMLLVENLGTEPIRIAAGARIAQGLIERNLPVAFQEVDPLIWETRATERGIGGFGSTGEA